MSWPRPVPLVGDTTSAAERRAAPHAWAFPPEAVASVYDVVGARRDVRRYRPDPVPEELLTRVLQAGHAAPSVGHSQPWRFLVVRDPALREQASRMADAERLRQAAQLDPESARHLLDLQLEGLREAPLGVVVCCDRRVPAAGVLGRATFPDSDVWSCACAIQNLWLAARAEGLGMGWVTLFRPEELAGLLDLPPGVVTLGWMCLGWPDERPPAPGLERAGWSRRRPLADVVMTDRWTETGAPVSHLSLEGAAAGRASTEVPVPTPAAAGADLPGSLRAPAPHEVVGARDGADVLLTPPGSLGVLDRVLDRVVALGRGELRSGTLVLAVGRHRVTELGVSAFAAGVTDDVLAAARAGQALGVVTAAASGLSSVVLDAGSATGDLLHDDALTAAAVEALLEQGRTVGREAAGPGLVALGEVGIGNTTVAAALTCALLGADPAAVVGRGSGADSAMLDRKREVVTGALARVGTGTPDRVAGRDLAPEDLLAALGGPEVALLTGVVLGAARAGAVVVLDGLLTSVAALLAVRLEPAVAAHLVAGQRSRETAHALVLTALGLEPLLDLRLRAGEGAGACLAAGMVLTALQVRRETARTG